MEELFMPGENETPKNVAENKQEEQEQPKQEKALFTREDLSKLVAEQLADKKAEWEKNMNDAVAKAKQDGKDEATMTAKELAEKHAKEREAELDKRDRLSKARDILSQQQLPTEAAELLVGKDDDETKRNIEAYQKLVEQGVKNAIHRNSAQKEPQNGGSGSDLPKKKFSDMTLDEQTALYRENPDLYMQLSQQN